MGERTEIRVFIDRRKESYGTYPTVVSVKV